MVFIKRINAASGIFLALSAGVLSAQMPVTVPLQTEARLPLSQAQEAEGCIDRACRWLKTKPQPKDRGQMLVRRYAETPADGLFQVAPCDRTPLEQILKKTAEAATEEMETTRRAAEKAHQGEAPFVWTFADALTVAAKKPSRLFAFQAALRPEASTPPDWRLQIALALVTSQQIDAEGGHWGDAESTVWAVLTLRSMLGRSAEIYYITPCPMPMSMPPKRGK